MARRIEVFNLFVLKLKIEFRYLCRRKRQSCDRVFSAKLYLFQSKTGNLLKVLVCVCCICDMLLGLLGLYMKKYQQNWVGGGVALGLFSNRASVP